MFCALKVEFSEWWLITVTVHAWYFQAFTMPTDAVWSQDICPILWILMDSESTALADRTANPQLTWS